MNNPPENSRKPHLALVTPAAVTEQLDQLRNLPAKKRMERLISDRQGGRLVRAMFPHELYWTAQEIGLDDALPLLELASPGQIGFCLDMELWHGWDFDPTRALEWLAMLREFAEPAVVAMVDQLDAELLILILQREVIVGGGLGDMAADEEKMVEWDHSFDQVFMLKFRNPSHSDLIMWFIDLVFRNLRPLYQLLMEGIRNEVSMEMEELCLQFRNSRLADLGFPAPEDARLIYAPLSPARYIPTVGKEPVVADCLPPVPLEIDSSLLGQALALAGDAVRVELSYLLNNALMAEAGEAGERETVRTILQRVKGRLNIALESLDNGHLEESVRILQQEKLVQLFRLGCGILAELRRRGSSVESDEFAVKRLLTGLLRERPVYYRGLDQEGFDSFREFASMADIRRVESILERFQPPSPGGII